MVNKKSNAAPAATTRYFEFVDEKSSKFWEIVLSRLDVKVRYGKIGTDGQRQDRAFADAAAAGKHADKLVAEKLGKGYREILATKAVKADSKKTTAVPKGTVATKRVAVEKKSLTKEAKPALVEDDPTLLDLRQSKLDGTIHLHMPQEFELAEKEGRPPLANICLSDNADVETIILPANNIGWDYCVIRDMPNLRELHVKRIPAQVLEHGGKKYRMGIEDDELKWLVLKDLPKLEKVTVEGSIVWLQVENLPSLKVIDVQGCEKLDYFSVLKAPKLEVVNAANCKKLRAVVGLTNQRQEKLGITAQILETQSKSMRDGKIYKNMTFTDVDHVLWTINYGVKIASLKGLFSEENSCFGREDDPDFNNFSFNVLRPLEHVYTGGTGETYAYVLWTDDYLGSVGNSSQELCLDYALNDLSSMDLDIPGKRNPTNQQILAFLNKLVEKETSS